MKALPRRQRRGPPGGFGIVQIHLPLVVAAQLYEVTAFACDGELVKEFTEHCRAFIGEPIGEQRESRAAAYRNSSIANCKRSSGR